MALTYQDINAYTGPYIVPRITHTISRNSPLLTRLESRSQKFLGGTEIRRPIIYNTLPVVNLQRGSAFDLTETKTTTAVASTIKLYGVNITLFATDAITNAGPHAAFSIVEERFQSAAVSMAQQLGTDLYRDSVGVRSLAITGLDQWYDDGNTFATVGGVTRSDLLTAGTVGALNCYVASTTSFTLRTLNTAYSQANWGSEMVDLIPCTLNGFNKIWEAVQPLQRYQNASGDLADIGFQAFRFNGADVVVDRNVPTGTGGRMYGLNTKYIELYHPNIPLFNYGFTGFKAAGNTLDHAGQFVVGMEMIVPNPRTGFKLTSTTEF